MHTTARFIVSIELYMGTNSLKLQFCLGATLLLQNFFTMDTSQHVKLVLLFPVAVVNYIAIQYNGIQCNSKMACKWIRNFKYWNCS